MKKFIQNMKKNTILLVIITIVVLYFVLKDDFNGILYSIENMNLLFASIALLLYITSAILKGLVNYKIINDPKKVSKREAVRLNFIAQFFNGITPFATGGEPMAVYMLTEQGIPVSKATNYMVQSFIFYQVALVLCGFIAVTYNFIFHLFPKVPFLQNLVFLGFLINIFVVVLLLMSYSKKTTNKLCGFTKKVSKKLKLNINEEDLEKKFDEYHEGLQEAKSRKGLFVFGVFVNMLSLICLYLSPYFVLRGLGDSTSMNIMDTIVSSAYVYLIGGFVPIPGASGGIEYGFTQFFGNFVTENMVKAMVLVWRSLTYYFGMIFGAILFNIRERVRK